MIRTPLDVRFVARGRILLLAPLVWGGRYPLVIPTGYVSNGGDKPAITWPLIGHPLSGSVLPCYVAHDYELDTGTSYAEAARRLSTRLQEFRLGWVRRSLIMTGVWAYVGWQAIRQNRPVAY